MKILKFPHPLLLKPCEEVTAFDEVLLYMLDSMWKTMKENKGMGLAANQVGIRLNMFVMQGPTGRINFCNPYIAASSVLFANLREGCLSAPGESVIVPGRAEWVSVLFQNENGVHQKVVLRDIYAVCAQHEIEHLEGKSFMGNKSILRATRKQLAKKWGLK